MSYVTVAEANTYVQMHYLATESVRVAWDALDESSRLVLLNRSFDRIERLPFVGRKHTLLQATAFPRDLEEEVPQIVKDAQVVEALSDSAIDIDSSEYRSMRLRGVKSYTIGHLSETFGGAVATQGDPRSAVSTQTLSMLAQYLSGGYCVCRT